MRIITKQQPSQTDAFKLSSRKNENFLHRRQAIQYPPANDRSLPAPDQTVLLARELGPRYLSSIQYYKYYLLQGESKKSGISKSMYIALRAIRNK